MFLKLRVAVFVDGYFWHCCPEHSNVPANNRAFWKEKFRKNRERDRLVNKELKERGWRVIRIWEHQLRRPERPMALRILRILEFQRGRVRE